MANRTTHRVGPGRRNKKVPRLLSIEDLDLRTGAAKAALATQGAIESDLGGRAHLSTLEIALAETAALTSAVVRDAGVRWLRGDLVPAGEIATLANALVRVATTLGLSKRVIDLSTNLDGYLESTNIEEPAPCAESSASCPAPAKEPAPLSTAPSFRLTA
jgi:hypothetical protein